MRAILILIFMVHALAAFGQSSTPADTLKIGIPANSADKGFIFDTGDGGSNKSLKIEKSTKLLKFDGNAVQIGDGALTADKEIKFNGTSGKVLKYDHTNTEFSINDDLAIDAGQKLKTNSIDSKSGTETAVEQNLRVKAGLKIGTGTVQLRDNSGKLEMSNDGTIWKKPGAGGGGAGSISILENGGFEDGITSGWSATGSTATAVTGSENALIGETSVSFDPSAQNDYLRTSYITVPKGLRGSSCEARFLYTGGDALNYSAKVETESGVILGVFNSGLGTNVLPYHNSIAGYESIFFKCPTQTDITTLSTNGNIRLVIYQGTVTNAAAMVVDDVHFGGLIGLVESGSPDNFGGYVSNAGTYLNGYGGVITGCSVASNVKTCNFQGLTVSPSCTIMPLEGNTNSLSMKITGLSNTFISFASLTPSTNTATALDLILQCSKAGADAKQSVQVYKSIPKNFDNQNECIVTFNQNTASIIDAQNCHSSISLAKPSAGNINITFAAGAYSVVPFFSCQLSNAGSGTAVSCVDNSGATATSPTLLPLRLLNTSGSQVDANFVQVRIVKRGADFKMPTVQPIVIGQVTNSTAESGLTNVRTESCQVTNNGTASIATGSGLCEGWIQSVTRSALGTVGVGFKTNTFSAVPVCVVSNTFQGAARACQIDGAAVQGGLGVYCATINPFSAVDAHFTLTCTGKR